MLTKQRREGLLPSSPSQPSPVPAESEKPLTQHDPCLAGAVPSLQGQPGVLLLAPVEWPGWRSMLEGPCTEHCQHTEPGRSSCCPKLLDRE